MVGKHAILLWFEKRKCDERYGGQAYHIIVVFIAQLLKIQNVLRALRISWLFLMFIFDMTVVDGFKEMKVSMSSGILGSLLYHISKYQ